jgi:hypothetical protein
MKNDKKPIQFLTAGFYGGEPDWDLNHGTTVTGTLAGVRTGLVTDGDITVVQTRLEMPSSKYYVIEKSFHALLLAADDIVKKGLIGKAVINMSFGYNYGYMPPATLAAQCKSLELALTFSSPSFLF